jgi:hypothetical protein
MNPLLLRELGGALFQNCYRTCRIARKLVASGDGLLNWELDWLKNVPSWLLEEQ